MIFPPGLVGDDAADVRRDFLGQLEVDAIEKLRVGFIYNRVVAMIQLERESVGKMFLLVGSQRVEKELSLIIVFLEFLPANSFSYTFDFRRIPNTSTSAVTLCEQ
jgi:hypothetical protein